MSVGQVCPANAPYQLHQALCTSRAGSQAALCRRGHFDPQTGMCSEPVVVHTGSIEDVDTWPQGSPQGFIVGCVDANLKPVTKFGAVGAMPGQTLPQSILKNGRVVVASSGSTASICVGVPSGR